MGCLYLLFALISPRILFVVLWIFTDYVRIAWDFWLWPLLLVIFMPVTGLALMWAYNTEFGLFQIAAIVVGVLMDLGSNSEAERRRRRQPQR